MICKIVSSAKQTPLIGAYTPPPPSLSILDHLPDIEEAPSQFPDREPIFIGNLNADIRHLQNLQNQQMAYFLMSFGLVNLIINFRQRFNFLHIQIWWHVRQGKLLHSRYYYILGLERRIFEMVDIRDPNNFVSEHFSL